MTPVCRVLGAMLAVVACVFSALPASAVAPPSAYGMPAYVYDAPAGLSDPHVSGVAPTGWSMALGATSWEGSASVRNRGVATNTADVAPTITAPYVRPSGATTPAQRAAVQGQPCVDCGAVAGRQVADHIDPLVREYYRAGTIDVARMRSLDAVQPQCPTCSARQGADLSRYSREMRQLLGLDP